VSSEFEARKASKKATVVKRKSHLIIKKN